MPDHHPAPPQAPVGALVELSRYHVTSGERIVLGQRIDGVVCITDAPAHDDGSTYVVERGLTSHDELLGLVTHYVEHAKQCDGIPLLNLYPRVGEISR